MFYWGLLAALMGNLFIGCGQALQKLGLNQLHLLQQNQVKKTEKEHGDAAPSRLRNQAWLLGILLCYLGEMGGNSVAIAFTSTTIVAPLGIVSVLVNALLAQRWLQERMTRRQWLGYAWILAGVWVILWAAPKSQSPIEGGILGTNLAVKAGQDSTEAATSSAVMRWLLVMQNQSRYLDTVMVLASFAVIILYTIWIRHQEQLMRYVLVCGCFGSMAVISTKALMLLIRAYAIDMANASSSLLFTDVHDTNTGAKTEEHEHGHRPMGLSVGPPAFTLLLTLLMAMFALEFIRQQALQRFPTSQFQPMMYAVFNGLVAISGVGVYRELDTLDIWGWWEFWLAFGIGMGLILQGSLLLIQYTGNVYALKGSGSGSESGLGHASTSGIASGVLGGRSRHHSTMNMETRPVGSPKLQ